MMNTAKEEIANEVAINKTATNSNTEIIFFEIRAVVDSTDSINRE
jgi:hypothetical protein